MRIVHLISFFLLFLSHSLSGQYYQYSQSNYAIQRVNPASISLDDYVQASFIYRSQRSISEVELNNYLVSAKYPFIKSNGGDRWSAIGLMMEGDQSGLNGLLETNKFGLSYALNFPTAKRKMLSLGLSLSYHSRKVNSSVLTTGNQFVPGLGFDPGIESGESLESLNTNYLSSSFGMIWQAVNKSDERQMHFGFSVYEFNRPDESLVVQGAQLPISFSLDAGYQIYDNSIISIYSEALYTFTKSTYLINVGFVTNYKLDRYDSRLAGQSIRLLTKYLTNQGILLGFQWYKEALSVGASYDIPINDRVANQGAFEIGLSLGMLMETKYKVKRRQKKRNRKKRAKNKSNGSKKKKTQTRNDTLSKKIDSGETKGKGEEILSPADSAQLTNKNIDHQAESANVESAEDKTDLVSTKAHIGDFKHAGFNKPMYFNFNFDLDKSVLKEEDKNVLNDLVSILKGDNSIVVVIEGHTDDIGPVKYNQNLSLRRARAVANYLFEYGISKERVDFYGRGEAKPLVENNSEQNRSQNRRVEFVLYQSKLD